MALENNNYSKDETIVDISHHNSDIDFGTAKNHVGMFIARTGDGHRLNTNGEFQGVVDRKYKKFVAQMKEHGIPFGNYMFNRFSGVASAKQEAEYFWEFGDKDATLWVCDAEVSTAPNMKECIQVFINRLRELGAKKVGLYIGHHKYQEFGGSSIDCDFTWIPRYGNKPAFACDLWQWTETGNIPGVGKCDINVLYGDKPLSWFTSKSKVVEKSYRISLGDFNELTWAGDTKRQVKELFPGYGVWDVRVDDTSYRILIGDFNSKEWADETFAKLKETLPNYGMWVEEL